jgi:hypothetical protein
MAYLGVDPWRWQYFAPVPCPDGITVPIDDATAWSIYPEHRWVYNKLEICRTQGLPHGPHGTDPDRFPVFSKPIYNMRGMGTGGRVVRSARAYAAVLQPGHMWMPYFTGDHVSTDVAIADGRPLWWRHTTGKPRGGGTFDYWTVHAEHRPALERYLGDWVRQNLRGFSGVVNFETIAGRIIECHLRMAEQWLDINGPGWLEAVVALYERGTWRWRDADRRTGYSVVLFGAHDTHWHANRAAIAAHLRRPAISSIQITFEEDKPPAEHAMPPGGFRLAIINCWDLNAGRRLRTRLKPLFSTG